MGKLTTHILDTAQGKPAEGVTVEVYSVETERTLISQGITNSEGRTDEPMLNESVFTTGAWELVFHVGDYFARQGIEQANPPFLDTVVVRFGIAEAEQHYHVPLLVSPWSYSTYRGS